MAKKKKNQCMFCGDAADSREHVFAKCFFDTPYPPNMLTVPTCKGCNHSFSLDEQYLFYLIDFFHSVEENEGNSIRELTEKTYQHNKNLEDRMFNSIKVDNEEKPYFRLEVERINRVVLKIARCLFYFHEGIKIPKEKLRCKWIMKPQLSTDQLNSIQKIRFNVLQEGNVKYYYQKERKEVGFCIEEFFYSFIQCVDI